jgi:UDP-3-O-[3-hydroxymyristoyl] glucosamine N-acyltransferase
LAITLGQLAEKLGARISGDPNFLIYKLSEIQNAIEGEITFLSNAKYAKYVEGTRASALIVQENMDVKFQNILWVKNAYAAMVEALYILNQKQTSYPVGIHNLCDIHAKASVHETAHIGAFVSIGENSFIGEKAVIFNNVSIGQNVSIGDNTIIHPNVTIYDDVVIGSACIIHAGTSIGEDGFGFLPTETGVRKIPQTGNVVIGDDVEIGANCSIDRGTIGSTSIGHHTKLDNLIHIAHNVKVGNYCFITAQVGIAGSSSVGNHVQMGGQSGIVGHVNVGNHVSIATRGGVTKDIEDNTMVSGFPARSHREMLKIEAMIQKLPKIYTHLKKESDSGKI